MESQQHIITALLPSSL